MMMKAILFWIVFIFFTFPYSSCLCHLLILLLINKNKLYITFMYNGLCHSMLDQSNFNIYFASLSQILKKYGTEDTSYRLKTYRLRKISNLFKIYTNLFCKYSHVKLKKKSCKTNDQHIFKLP